VAMVDTPMKVNAAMTVVTVLADLSQAVQQV
jgi:hypothetical protein